MKLNSISGIVFYVQDLSRTAEFYEALGFRRGKEEADRLTFYVNWFFVTFSNDEQAEDAELANRGAGLFLQVKVDDIEDFHRGVVAKGMKARERAAEPAQWRSGVHAPGSRRLL